MIRRGEARLFSENTLCHIKIFSHTLRKTADSISSLYRLIYLCGSVLVLVLVNVEKARGQLAACAARHVDLSSVSGHVALTLQLRSNLIHECELRQDRIIILTLIVKP